MFELKPVRLEGRLKLFLRQEQEGALVMDEDVQSMASQYPELAEAYLPKTHFGREGVEALATLSHLEKLDLSNNPNIGDEEARVLAALPVLLVLELSRTAIGDDGAIALAEGCPGLKIVDLTNTGVGRRGRKALEARGIVVNM